MKASFQLFILLFSMVGLLPGHEVLTQGKGKLVVIKDGKTIWEMGWGGIHDVHVLPSGNFLVQEKMRKLVEIDRATKKVVWSYDASQSNGNREKRMELHSFQPLGDDRFMLAESGPARIIEVDRSGKLLKEVRLTVDKPNAHTDTRLVRKLESGYYLVCHEADGKVREYDGEGKVVWEYEVPLFGKKPKRGHGLEGFGNRVFSALRLRNGNTLIGTGNGHSVLEVTPEKEVAWALHQDDLPGIRLAWVTTLEVLPNGNYVIGNCHAGPGNPLLVEIEPKTKEVVWTFDHFEQLGNAVSNSLLLDLAGKTIR